MRYIYVHINAGRWRRCVYRSNNDSKRIALSAVCKSKMAAIVFLTQCSISIASTTLAGKTSLLRRLLRYRDVLFNTDFTSITYFYTVWQKFDGEMGKEFGGVIQFTEGFPTKEDVERIGSGSTGKLILLDDMMAGV